MHTNLRLRILELQKEIAGDVNRVTSEKGKNRLNGAYNIILKFDTLASCLYEARRTLPANDRLISFAEDVVASLSHSLVQLQDGGAEGNATAKTDKSPNLFPAILLWPPQAAPHYFMAAK